MTRKRCINRWCVLVIVVLVLHMLGTSSADAQERSTRVRGGGLQNLVPESDSSVERLVGAEAWRLLEEKVIAKDRGAWEAAIKRKEARGWTKTDRVVALRARQGARFTRTQAQAFDIGGALLIEWEWLCDPYHACGTYYFESYYDGGNITYDAEFVPTGPGSGYAPWAAYIGGSAGRDSRRQRAAQGTSVPRVRPASLETMQRAPGDDYCPGELWYWNQCMRECLARRHETAMIGVAASVGGALMACARAVRPNSILVMGVTYLGCLTLSAGTAAMTSFSAAHYWSPCDSYGGQCGPKPC